MPIDHDTEVDETVVREGPGWKQITPPNGSNKGRTYLDCAAGDDRWPECHDEFDSMTSALRTGFPTDFTGPTKWNQARWTWANRADLMTLSEADAIARMVESSNLTLNVAANRGTGMHGYIEDRLHGRETNWEWLAEMGSLPWIAAAENFLRIEQPIPVLIERVCFDRERMVAGTVDAVLELPKRGWALAEIDWKSREQKSRRDYTHARRPKEAAQLGGYFKMLTKGYYFDDRARRCQLPAEEMHVAVVTFGTDGTYAVHEVDAKAAVVTYELAMEMRKCSRTSYLMPHKADYAEPFDPNPIVAEAIGHIPVEHPDYFALGRAWSEAGLPRVTEGELTPDRFGEAMSLIYTHASQWQPWTGHHTPEPACSQERHDELVTRFTNLPLDWQDQAERHATGLTSLDAVVMSETDADAWDEILARFDDQLAVRQLEIDELLRAIRELPWGLDILKLLPSPERWTDAHLDIAEAMFVACHDTGAMGWHNDRLTPAPSALDALATRGKREVVREAKALAEKYGLPRPSKWDDLIGDPRLYAVVVTA
jgi:hypothetical protein